MTQKVKFKIPDSVKQSFTGKKCQKLDVHGRPHNSAIFLIHGKEVCGQCQIEATKRLHDKLRDENIDDEKLKQYYEDKRAKKEKKTDYKSQQYKD